MSHRTFRRMLATVTTLVLLAGCATNPVTGRRELNLVGEGQEAQMGADGYKAAVAEYGLYPDQRLQSYVNGVGQKLAAVSHLPNQKWTFTVLDDPAVNAFAMPGGYVYVTRGIMAHLENEAQLAGVMGHEIGHVTARHSARRITQSQLASLGLGVASIVSSGFRQYGGLAEQAMGLMFLKYSRDDENQADELGVGYAAKAGYDVREIPATYGMLKRVGDRAGQRLPAFLSTHPDPGGREQHTAQLAQQAIAGRTGLAINERVYLTGLDGVTFGRDPRTGYFDNGVYYNPELRFQMRFPAGWQTQDTKSAVIAAEPNQQGVAMQLTLAPPSPQGASSPEAYVAELQQAGKISGSRGDTETIGGHPAWVGQIGVKDANGAEVVLAAAWIRRSNQMFQILGKGAQPGDNYEQQIYASARSIRDLNDPARLNVRPAVIDVVPAPRSGPFQDVVAGMRPLAIEVEELSIMNQVMPDQPVQTGQLLKVVRPN